MFNNDDNIIYLDTGRKSIYIEIDKERYFAKLSIGDLLLPKIEIDNNFDCRNYVSSQLIYAVNSENRPTLEQVKSQNDDFFIRLFDCFLANNTEFYAVYSEVNCTEICEHYMTAYQKYCFRRITNGSDRISDSIAKTGASISELFTNAFQSIDLTFFESLSEKIKSAMSWYIKYDDTITSGIRAALESLCKIGETILSGISESLQHVHIPEITEERKKELLNSYEQWGKYGWTVPPFAEINCFNKCPPTLIEADKTALQYCRKADMQMLFSSLEDMCVRKKDVREAICCYKAHQYKACALILFSIIDSRLIRLQRKRDGKYSVGIGAINRFKRIVEQQTADRGKLFLSLSYANLFSCLFSVFENTDDFSKTTIVINRNYLDHGMSCKTVRRKDCIKLFLLLYNLLEFIDIIR